MYLTCFYVSRGIQFWEAFKRTLGSFSKFWKNIHPCLGVVIERGIDIETNISMEQKCGGNNKSKLGLESENVKIGRTCFPLLKRREGGRK